jgi:hypothetical protein
MLFRVFQHRGEGYRLHQALPAQHATGATYRA